MSFMLSVANDPIMLSVIMISVVMMNVVVPFPGAKLLHSRAGSRLHPQRLERQARDKHSSLFVPFVIRVLSGVSYHCATWAQLRRKKLYNIGLRADPN